MRVYRSFPPPSENAFDFLRVAAAWAVLYSHSFAVVGLPEPQPIAGQSFGSLAVATFFAISGFLVCQSWRRDPSIWRFAARRALRILPGLSVVVLITALIIGPIFSSLPIRDYFLDVRSWLYIPKAISFIAIPILPGLFETNPYPNANNGSLWTLRYEALMYGGLALAGSLAAPKKLLAAIMMLLAGCVGLWLVLVFLELAPWPIPFVWRLGTELYGDRVGYLGAYFFAGCFAQIIFMRIPISLTAAAALMAAASFIPDKRAAMIFLWLAIPYSAITFAYRAPAIFRRVNGHDYSYGLYIYAFPVQQVVAQVTPTPSENWLLTLVVSTVITGTLAGLSWRFIERPALGMKHLLIRPQQKPG